MLNEYELGITVRGSPAQRVGIIQWVGGRRHGRVRAPACAGEK